MVVFSVFVSPKKEKQRTATNRKQTAGGSFMNSAKTERSIERIMNKPTKTEEEEKEKEKYSLFSLGLLKLLI